LEWAHEATIPFATRRPVAAAATSKPRIDWAIVGEYSVAQFHAAKTLLGRYNVPCRAGDIAADSPNMMLEVPQAALLWVRSLLAEFSASRK
jgi:hypothetical protein